jgi:hypothetical protein
MRSSPNVGYYFAKTSIQGLRGRPNEGASQTLHTSCEHGCDLVRLDRNLYLAAKIEVFPLLCSPCVSCKHFFVCPLVLHINKNNSKDAAKNMGTNFSSIFFVYDTFALLLWVLA